MTIRDEFVTGSYSINYLGEKVPINWEKYAVKLETYIISLRKSEIQPLINIICDHSFLTPERGYVYCINCKKSFKITFELPEGLTSEEEYQYWLRYNK